MFFLMTHYDNQPTDEKYLSRKVNGMPRIVSMSMNLSLLSPVMVITESNKISDLLKQYNIRHEVVKDEVSNFEIVGEISKSRRYEKAISIFTPESFLEDIYKLDSIMDAYRQKTADLERGDSSVLTFFTTDRKVKMNRDSYISLNEWGGVKKFTREASTPARQIGFYVLNPQTLDKLNKLGKEIEFNNLAVEETLKEEEKMIYYSVPVKLIELKKLRGEQDPLEKRG